MREAMGISRRSLFMGLTAVIVTAGAAAAQTAVDARARRRDQTEWLQQRRYWQRRQTPVDLSGESRVPGVGAPSRPIPPGPGSMTVPNR